MSEEAQVRWNHAADAILGMALAMAMAVGGYYVNQLDKRDKAQDEALIDHSQRITRNEKEIEFATRKFSQIDEKLDELLHEVRAIRERP